MKPKTQILLQLLTLAALGLGLFPIQPAKALDDWRTNYVLNVMSGTPGAGWQAQITTPFPDNRGYSNIPYWDKPGDNKPNSEENGYMNIGAWVQGRNYWWYNVNGSPLERQGLRWWGVPFSQTVGQTQPGVDSNFWFQANTHTNLWVTLHLNEAGLGQNVVLYIAGGNPPPMEIWPDGSPNDWKCRLNLIGQYQYPFQFNFALGDQSSGNVYCTSSSANYDAVPGGLPLDYYQHFVLFERPAWYLTGAIDIRSNLVNVLVNKYQSLVLASEDTGYNPRSSDYNEAVVTIEDQDRVKYIQASGTNIPVSNLPKYWVMTTVDLTSNAPTNETDRLDPPFGNFFETEMRLNNQTGHGLNKLRIQLYTDNYVLYPTGGRWVSTPSDNYDNISFLDCVPEDQWLDTVRLSLGGNDLGSWRDTNALWSARRNAGLDWVNIWFTNSVTWANNVELDLHFGMLNWWRTVGHFHLEITTNGMPDQPDRGVMYSLPYMPFLSLASHVASGATAYGLAVSSNLAYLVGSDGLSVYNISNPAAPSVLSHIDTGTGPPSVAIYGHYAVLANYILGLSIYDVANSTNPTNVANAYDGGKGQYVTVASHYAYLANDTDGLRIYDISTPNNPISVGHVNDGAKAFGVTVSGSYAYLANSTDGLRIYDISNPTNPIGVGHINDGGSAWSVAVSGNYAYLANSSDGLRIYNILNPTNPISVGHINDNGSASDVTVVGHVAYLADGSGGLRIYDVANPASPVSLTSVNEGGSANGVAISGYYIYVANSSDGLRIYYFPGVIPSIPIPTIGIVRTNGVIEISLSGEAGDVIRVLASSNLFDWQTIATVTNLTGAIQFIDTGATNFTQRFYRTVTP